MKNLATSQIAGSFRLKFILVALSGVAMLVFAVLVSGSYYVNLLQRENVQAAVELAQEQARRLATDIMEAYEAQGTADNNAPAQFAGKVQSLTEVVVRRNRDIVWVGVFDASGRRIIEDTVDPATGERRFSLLDGDDAAYTHQIQQGTPAIGMNNSGAEIDIEVRGGNNLAAQDIVQPVASRDGKKIGEIVVRIDRSPQYQRILTSSQQITKILGVQLLVVAAALAVLFTVLWRLFVRHVQVLKHNEQLDRLAYVGGMASGLAHEIRNPLGAISLNMQLVQEELDIAATTPADNTNENATRMVQAVNGEVSRLNTMLTRFLEFAVPRKDAFVQFSLVALITEIAELNRPLFENNAIAFQIDFAKNNDAEIEGDRTLLHQVFTNVLINAIQMMDGALKRNLRIEISGAVATAERRVSFYDTGPGIDPQDIDRIFDVFVSRRRGGSGLGLPTARRIVHEHGGRIWAENNSDRPGAVFHIVLPKKGQRPNAAN